MQKSDRKYNNKTQNIGESALHFITHRQLKANKIYLHFL